jgi:plastocyanin
MTVRHLLVLATLAVVTVVPLLPVGADARSPVYLQVVEKEYTLQLSRLRVPAGPTIVQAVNFGMDNHDLVMLRNKKGSKPIVFKKIGPNSRVTKMLKLAPGRYTLWCSVPGHRERGMVASLRVR